MTEEIFVAFAASSRDWFPRWSSHLYDYGPNLIDVVAEARNAFDRTWRVIVIDTASSLLEPAFVASVHARGRGVLAVWDPNEPATKAQAMDAGADELIESEALAIELVAAIVEMAVRFEDNGGDESKARRRPPVVATPRQRAGQLIAVGGPIGADPAQVLLGMARALGGRKESVLVVDGDEAAPSLAQLLTLAPVPNLSSAAASARAGTDMDANLQEAEGFYLLAGLAGPAQWVEVGSRAVLGVVIGLADRFTRTLVSVAPLIEDVGNATAKRFGTSRAVLAEADAIVAVADAAPVGLARLAQWAEAARLLAPSTPLYLVAGGAPRDRFRQSHVSERLSAIANPTGIALLPADTARQRAAEWQGEPLRRGPLLRATSDLADLVCPRPRRRK